MSNEVYGYIKSNELNSESFVLLDGLQKKTGIGFTEIPSTELYNFPDELMPSEDGSYLSFIVGDRPGKTNATYLIDYVDYALEADIGLPHKGSERLKLLVKSLIIMIEEVCPERFIIALTDSSQIEEVKIVKLSKLLSTIISDCKEYTPPDCIYDVLIDCDICTSVRPRSPG